MLIREAREAELDDVADLMVEAYRQYTEDIPARAWDLYRADILDVRGRAANSVLLVCEDGGALAGAVTFYAPGSFGLIPAELAYFRLLAVAPSRRGRGVGRALVEATIARARECGADALAIHTIPFMAGGRALYESMGFVRDPRLDLEPADFTLPDGSPIRILGYRLELTGGGSAASAM